jgi:hypothetical protein
VLLAGALTESSALFIQGTTEESAGAGTPFGDGLRCAGGTVVRLDTRQAVNGAACWPGPGDPSISQRGGVAAPGKRVYQVWYRNAAAYCTSSTFKPDERRARDMDELRACEEVGAQAAGSSLHPSAARRP